VGSDGRRQRPKKLAEQRSLIAQAIQHHGGHQKKRQSRDLDNFRNTSHNPGLSGAGIA
jgi:hypothetical protein